MSKCYSRDPKVRAEFDAREKALKDRTSALNYAKAEGIKIGEANAQAKVEEGKAEGLAEGKAAGTLETKLENAKSLLDILDDVTIANKIGLDVSKVTQLRDEVEG